MSIAFYNQKWETAISNLLENVQEENFPLEENRNDKGVPPILFRSTTSGPTTSGSNTTEDSTFAISKPTVNWRTLTTRWSTLKNEYS